MRSTFQTTPVPSRKPRSPACRPKNVPQPPASAPGSGAPMSLPELMSQRRSLPSVLVVSTRCRGDRTSRSTPTRSDRQECAGPGGRLADPRTPRSPKVSRRDHLAVGREPDREQDVALPDVRGALSSTLQTTIAPPRPAAATSVPSELKSRSWNDALPGAVIVPRPPRRGGRRFELHRRCRRCRRACRRARRRRRRPLSPAGPGIERSGGSPRPRQPSRASPVAAISRPSWLNAIESTAAERTAQRRDDCLVAGAPERDPRPAPATSRTAIVWADRDAGRSASGGAWSHAVPPAGADQTGTAARGDAIRDRPTRSRCHRSTRSRGRAVRAETGPSAAAA